MFQSIGAVPEEAATLGNLAYVLHYGLSETEEAVELIEHAIELMEQNNLPFDAAGTSIEEHRAFLEELK